MVIFCKVVETFLKGGEGCEKRKRRGRIKGIWGGTVLNPGGGGKEEKRPFERGGGEGGGASTDSGWRHDNRTLTESDN